MRKDYETEIEQQERQIDLLKQDTEGLKRNNQELQNEGIATNGTIVEAKSMVNQREIEVTKLSQDIQRAQDEDRQLNTDIDTAQRNLREAHKVKDLQHERIYQATAQLKKQEQACFADTSKSNQCTSELNQLQDRAQRLDVVLN